MQRTRASFAVGLNRPVSMDEMVWRETPTSPASSACESPASARAAFSRLQISSEYKVDDDADDRDRHQNARTQRGFVTKLVELVEVHGGYARHDNGERHIRALTMKRIPHEQQRPYHHHHGEHKVARTPLHQLEPLVHSVVVPTALLQNLVLVHGCLLLHRPFASGCFT